ncbi:MAG: type II toxin-antitoxin system HicB family antitoxin [Xanthobacteraceae bacterium]
MHDAVAIETAGSSDSAFVPDPPGCGASGATIADVEADIREAIRFHTGRLRADGGSRQEPTSLAEYVQA